MTEESRETEKKCDTHDVVSSENCNLCGEEISIEEFDYGMCECLVCFPNSQLQIVKTACVKYKGK